MVLWTLNPICSIYVSLHRGTDSAPTLLSHNPSSFPLCAVLHHNPELVPAISGPEALSSSPPSPLRVIESFTDEPLLDNFHHAHRSTIESIRIPVASSTLATASALQDTVNSGVTTPNPTPDTSTSPPFFPTSSPAVVALEQNPEPPTASNLPNLPPSASLGPVLDNILPTGAPLSSLSSMTPSYTSLPFPGSRHPTIAAAAPTASPGPTSAPNLGAAIEGDSSLEPGLRDNKDALGPPSVNQAIYAKPIDLPSQLPSLPSVTDSDVVIAISSMWEPNTEHRGGHPLDPSHGQYNIV
ncbi:hypothetical protein H4582DRAFT_1894416 [Lactarius indigo]|nr:hypothetical protein H4582DRAFT_1894416 [Lactarius indigo]